jgi:hypothetical protein
MRVIFRAWSPAFEPGKWRWHACVALFALGRGDGTSLLCNVYILTTTCSIVMHEHDNIHVLGSTVE